MPQFHETGYGRRFFEAQLPALTKAINRLATALEQRDSNTAPDSNPVEKEKENGGD